jgi:hypothetical protein
MKRFAGFSVYLHDMMRVPIVVTASLALMLSMAVAPPTALAERFRGGPGGQVVVTPRRFAPQPPASRPFVPQRPLPRSFVGPFVPQRPLHRPFVGPFSPHRHFARPFVRPFVLSGPVVVQTYTPPPVVSYPSAAYAEPTYYPPAVYSPPAPPPTPSVVEYPTGRYELRGDGVGTPYTWVWIPNPPPAPPAELPPAAPAPVAPPTAPGASDDPSPRHRSQLYRWVDPAGVVHWTDRMDAVPGQYRSVVVDRAPSLR